MALPAPTPAPPAPPGGGPPPFQPRAWLRRNAPWLVLILASITFAEFLTGSTPVLVPLLDPVSAMFLIGLYGAGVLLVREASIRWNKGWPTILLLGAAYGIAEEGLGTKTFFGRLGVGYLGVYGHFAGVNWVWATELALFHAIFSIALPIAVVALMFPATARIPFLPARRSLPAVLTVYLATVGAMFILFNPQETPSALVLVAAVAAIGILVALARRAPASLRTFRPSTVGRPTVDHPILAGALFVWGFFALAWVAPPLVPIPVVVALALVVWAVAFGLYVARHAEAFQRPAIRLDFILGALTFGLVLATVMGFFGDWGAIPVVGIVIYVGWRLRQRLAEPARTAVPVPAGASGFGG
ncbi:MAG: hypothetical protein L3K00_02610 [Thermoplasmata archaeon]|nr:hypothetical protein [Thermoplasmata archaeon]